MYSNQNVHPTRSDFHHPLHKVALVVNDVRINLKIVKKENKYKLNSIVLSLVLSKNHDQPAPVNCEYEERIFET